MKYLTGLLLALSLIFLTPSFIYAADYYVSTSGNDSNNGSIGSPWRTIQKAANTLVAGDKVEIMQGSYSERVSPSNSGSAANPIVYKNYGADVVIINPPNALDSYAVYVNGKNYLEFRGLSLIQSGISQDLGLGSGIWIRNGSHHILLDGLTIKNNRFGILLDGKTALPVDHITILNNTISDNVNHGIFMYEKVYESEVGPNNHITNNGSNAFAFGIEIGTVYPGLPENGANKIEVFANEIDNNGVQGIRTWNASNVWIHNNHLHHNGATGIQLENGSRNILVENNRSEYNARAYEYETGIWIDSTQNAVVQNNSLRGNKLGLIITDSNQVIARNNIIFENNQGYGGLLNAMGFNIDSNANNVIFIHNTFYKNGASGSQRAGISFCAYHPPSEILIKNNIISESANNWDLWVDAGCTGYSSDYNNYFNTKALNIKWHGTNYSWTNYQNISGQDLHSITGNPEFIDPLNFNFELLSTSPNIDSGDYLTRTSSSGSGTNIAVVKASFFTNGTNFIPGDLIKIGSNSARVTNVDYINNIISIDSNITWNANDPVSYQYSGSKPDRGAFEYNEIIPTPTQNPTSTPVPTPKPGDANEDGLVNESDYAIWLANYNQQHQGPNFGDFNYDGVVNGVDYVIWLNNFGL